LNISKAIRDLQEVIRRHGEILEKHTVAILELQREIKRLGDRVTALGVRWGIYAEEVSSGVL